MMLKKQTVWLLTMLSLIIVLSVYYMTSPGPSPSEVAFTQEDEEQNKDQSNNEEKQSDQDKASKDQKGTAMTSIAGEEVFAAAKNRMQESRAELTARYNNVIASESSSAKEVAKAQEKIEQLNQLSSKEKQLESLIIAKGYSDALVNAKGQEVKVIVKANSLSNKQTVEIMNLVNSNITQANDIAVTFQPGDQ